MNAANSVTSSALAPQTSSTRSIADALAHHSTHNLKRYYDHWARHYDADVEAEAYCGPAMVVDLLDAVAQQANVGHDSHVLDACCGTGLVGRTLHERGYRQISGCDLSAPMIDQAHASQAYQHLYSQIDLTQPLPRELLQRFDAVVCCGAFIPGHLPASALRGLLAMTRPGGVVVLSIREAYYDTAGFEPLLQALWREQGLSVLQTRMSARYLQNARAHYLALHVA
ncbi:class I SAM-dependent DNA methyltransferase [Pseudomonas rhizosphaerae]|uniref:class I SAM-dependent DNA methyltransferase n=3 Tax=Pseudomonas rhizosphaerae TaxID=216142 RepID=UPI00177B33B0|nr:class I SAM-dependent methyltransferase [Pseudomonas rhizosphaerae]MBD8616688.1 class I SAM-dependent methyltransferase [Pseudomonas putida]MEB2871979.1 class I SAM-dependent methyltransferase [Pseudomonas rhizosphaerae]